MKPRRKEKIDNISRSLCPELQIYVEEEYGYKNYLWTPNLPEDVLISWWRNNSPLFHCGILREEYFPGKMEEIDLDDMNYDHPHQAHIHEDFDSYLILNDKNISFQEE